jgi:hypothetical protein
MTQLSKSDKDALRKICEVLGKEASALSEIEDHLVKKQEYNNACEIAQINKLLSDAESMLWKFNYNNCLTD